MADSKGRKWGNIHYDRKPTRLENELLRRGYKAIDMWIMVGDTKDGKSLNHDDLDKFFDQAQYYLGTQKIENVAVACDVSFMTVVDWIRLDREPEKMTRTQFDIYKRRIGELSNADKIRWYLAMLCRKKIPLLQVLDAAVEDYDFKKEGYLTKSQYAYKNFISKGILLDPSKKKDKKKED